MKAEKTNFQCLIPVSMKSGFFRIQFGMASAENKENPKTKIFLEEFMSVDWKMRCVSKRALSANETNFFRKHWKKQAMLLFTCRLEIPAAAMTPNMIRNIPPITGAGIVVNAAPILPSIPIKIMKTPLRRTTVRLATCCHTKDYLKWVTSRVGRGEKC